MDYEIRPVTAGELAQVEPLIAAYQRFYEVEDIDGQRNREFFSRFVGESRGPADPDSKISPDRGAEGWLLAAWNGGEPVAFACFYRHKSSLTATDTVLMNDLYVNPELRGGGIGRALIEEGLRLVGESGASCLEWSTAPDNHRAQRLYDSTGAEKTTWLTYELEP
jgi:ribosomal protein S18 acetylase RimI-like enzyme